MAPTAEIHRKTTVVVVRKAIAVLSTRDLYAHALSCFYFIFAALEEEVDALLSQSKPGAFSVGSACIQLSTPLRNDIARWAHRHTSGVRAQAADDALSSAGERRPVLEGLVLAHLATCFRDGNRPGETHHSYLVRPTHVCSLRVSSLKMCNAGSRVHETLTHFTRCRRRPGLELDLEFYLGPTWKVCIRPTAAVTRCACPCADWPCKALQCAPECLYLPTRRGATMIRVAWLSPVHADLFTTHACTRKWCTVLADTAQRQQLCGPFHSLSESTLSSLTKAHSPLVYTDGKRSK